MIAPIFADRSDAGRQLGAALKQLRLSDPVVLALPRGGVPVGYRVAEALLAPLDVLLVRKIGAPMHPELALGAQQLMLNPTVVINENVTQAFEDIEGFLQEELGRELEEIARRRRLYRGNRAPLSITGKDAIVVDDGIATGATVRAALEGLRRANPRGLTLAVPVAPRDTIEKLRPLADEIVCLATPQPFIAVGLFYMDFSQTTDAEVIELLAAARARFEGAEPRTV